MRGAFATGYLTPCEREILRLIALGHHNRGIAAMLTVTESTVVKHRGNLCRKLDAHSPVDLCRCAIALGLIKIEVTPLVRIVAPQRRERWVIPQTQAVAV